ncbi:bis(5'-nucleosidyl)-tetraphosphatase [Sarotherodon galilaeus]
MVELDCGEPKQRVCVRGGGVGGGGVPVRGGGLAEAEQLGRALPRAGAVWQVNRMGCESCASESSGWVVQLSPLSVSLAHTCTETHPLLSSPPLLSAISSSTRPGLMLLPGLCDVAIGGPERKPDMGFSAGLVGPEETRSTGGGGGRSGPRGACQ